MAECWTICTTCYSSCSPRNGIFRSAPPSRQTWKYSKLIDEVERGKVENVKLSADRTKAVVTDQEGTSILG